MLLSIISKLFKLGKKGLNALVYAESLAGVGSMLSGNEKQQQQPAGKIKKSDVIPRSNIGSTVYNNTLVAPEIKVEPITIELVEVPKVITDVSTNLPIPIPSSNVINNNKVINLEQYRETKNIQQTHVINKSLSTTNYIKNLNVRVIRNEQRLNTVGHWAKNLTETVNKNYNSTSTNNNVEYLNVRVNRNEQRLDAVGPWARDLTKKIGVIEESTRNTYEVINETKEVAENSRQDFRRERIRNERRRDEEDTEKTKYKNDVFNRIEETAEEIKRGILSGLSALALPLVALAASPRIFENEENGIVEMIDEIQQGAANIASASRGVRAGGITQTTMMASIRDTKAGRVVGGFMEKRNIRQSIKAMTPERAVALKETMLGAAPERATNALNRPGFIPPMSPRENPNAMMKAIRRMQSIFEDFNKMTKKISTNASNFIQKLPKNLQKFVRVGLRKIIKWYLIFEGLDLILRNVQLYGLGVISKEDYHKGNMTQLNRIIKAFGVPWILGFIFSAVAMITIPVPFLANLVGGVLGFIVGLFFGDKIYDALNIDLFVNALYEFIVLRSTDGFKEIGSKIRTFVMNALPKMLKNAAIDAAKGVFHTITFNRFYDEKDNEERGRNKSNNFSVKHGRNKSNNVSLRQERNKQNVNISLRRGRNKQNINVIGGYKIVQTSHPDTGSGYTIEGHLDAQGRPAVFSARAVKAFAEMMKDSQGKVKTQDIASSQRSVNKNQEVGGAIGSKHVSGRAIDIHGESNEWIRIHGMKYGWAPVDYVGTHGGHFVFDTKNKINYAPETIESKASNVTRPSPQSSIPMADNIQSSAPSMEDMNQQINLIVTSPARRGRNNVKTKGRFATDMDSTPSYITRDSFLNSSQSS